MGRFVPCSIGANHCRLRHLGWERCSHGLTSRPRESASAPFLDQLLLLFHYPSGSSGALLAGTLPLRYCSFKFAAKTPFWGLACSWSCFWLVTVHDQATAVGSAEVAIRGSGSWRKRFRLNRKNTCTPRRLSMCILVHVCGRGCIFQGFCVSQMLIVRGGGTISRKVVTVLFFPGLVLGDLVMRRPTSQGLHG